MEPSTFFIDREIVFKKADMEALEEGKYTKSPWYRVCELSNVKYCISIYPNRGHQRSWIFLHLFLGQAANVDADANVVIQNSNFSVKFKTSYKVNTGWGKWICATSELFDDKNSFFTDGEMIVKIKCSFIIEFYRIKYPFSVQWKIKESDLKGLENDCLYSKDLTASDFDGKCYISFFPNGDDNEESQGETWIFLHLELESNSKIEAVWKYSIDSVNFVDENKHVFEETDTWGFRLCSNEELFIPENRYFVDGELTLKITGTLMVEKEKEPTILALDNGIVQKGYHRGKNFTFIIGEKSIKDAIQDYLIHRISPTNVCSLINATTTFINAPKLLPKSKEYLIKCLNKKTAIHDLDILDKNVLVEMFMIISSKNV